jgi:hypothetical protein
MYLLKMQRSRRQEKSIVYSNQSRLHVKIMQRKGYEKRSHGKVPHAFIVVEGLILPETST